MLLRESVNTYATLEKCTICSCYVHGWNFSSLNPNVCKFCTAQHREHRMVEMRCAVCGREQIEGIGCPDILCESNHR